jgi:hypothetical protein
MPVEPHHVYTGLWTNWSRGPVLGSTITVPSSTGIILTAFLAIYIQVAGAHLWDLVRYVIHQLRATEKAIHPLQRQILAILRNKDSALSSSFEYIRMLRAWRGSGRSYPAALASILAVSGFAFTAAITAAGIFSTAIIDVNDIEVLLVSPYCGHWLSNISEVTRTDSTSDVPDLLHASELLGVQAEATRGGLIYANDCYNGTSTTTCDRFPVQTINWTTDYLATCPFDASMCVGPAMKMHTGRMNTNDILGLNAPMSEQLEYRKVTTCAPLTQQGFVESEPVSTTYRTGRSTIRSNQWINRYMYGESFSYGDPTETIRPYTLQLDATKSNSSAGYTIL